MDFPLYLIVLLVLFIIQSSRAIDKDNSDKNNRK